MACSPWYDVKVTVLGLKVVSEDLPAQLDAPTLARRSLGCTGPGTGGQLGHLQHLDAHVSSEQLEKQPQVEPVHCLCFKLLYKEEALSHRDSGLKVVSAILG